MSLDDEKCQPQEQASEQTQRQSQVQQSQAESHPAEPTNTNTEQKQEPAHSTHVLAPLFRVLARIWNRFAPDAKDISLVKLEENLDTSLRLISRFIATILVVGLFVLSLRGLFDSKFLMESFNVPEELEANGFTGDVLRDKLLARISSIPQSGITEQQEGSDPNEQISTAQSYFSSEMNIAQGDIEIFGVSLNALKTMIRNGLGISNVTITGNLIQTNGEFELEIIEMGQDKQLRKFTINRGIANTNEELGFARGDKELLDSLIDRAALYVLERKDPIILAYYYYSLGKLGVAEMHLQQAEAKTYKKDQERPIAKIMRLRGDISLNKALSTRSFYEAFSSKFDKVVFADYKKLLIDSLNQLPFLTEFDKAELVKQINQTVRSSNKGSKIRLNYFFGYAMPSQENNGQNDKVALTTVFNAYTNDLFNAALDSYSSAKSEYEPDFTHTDGYLNVLFSILQTKAIVFSPYFSGSWLMYKKENAPSSMVFQDNTILPIFKNECQQTLGLFEERRNASKSLDPNKQEMFYKNYYLSLCLLRWKAWAKCDTALYSRFQNVKLTGAIKALEGIRLKEDDSKNWKNFNKVKVDTVNMPAVATYLAKTLLLDSAKNAIRYLVGNLSQIESCQQLETEIKDFTTRNANMAYLVSIDKQYSMSLAASGQYGKFLDFLSAKLKTTEGVYPAIYDTLKLVPAQFLRSLKQLPPDIIKLTDRFIDAAGLPIAYECLKGYTYPLIKNDLDTLKKRAVNYAERELPADLNKYRAAKYRNALLALVEGTAIKDSLKMFEQLGYLSLNQLQSLTIKLVSGTDTLQAQIDSVYRSRYASLPLKLDSIYKSISDIVRVQANFDWPYYALQYYLTRKIEANSRASASANRQLIERKLSYSYFSDSITAKCFIEALPPAQSTTGVLPQNLCKQPIGANALLRNDSVAICAFRDGILSRFQTAYANISPEVKMSLQRAIIGEFKESAR